MNVTKTLFFTDLDDTLFQSRAKLDSYPDINLTPIAFLSNGDPHGFAKKNQIAFLKAISSFASVIPTTARNLDSYRRVNLDMPSPPFAILNHGGTIIDGQGQPLPYWQEKISQIMQPWSSDLKSMANEINAWSSKTGRAVYARVIGDMSQDLYVLVKDRQKDQNQCLSQLRIDWLEKTIESQEGLVIHQNANNLTIQPKDLDKSAAVSFLVDQYRREYPDLLVLGAGDSNSDRGFLSLCDYAIIPRNAQINIKGGLINHV